MGVLFAYKGLAGEQHGFGADGKDAERTGFEGEVSCARGFADRSAHGPDFSFGGAGE